MRTVDEPGKDVRIVRVVVAIACFPLDRDRLTERDGLLAFPDEAPQLAPSQKRCDRTRLNAARSLRSREELVSDAVSMERLVSRGEYAGLVD